MCGEGQREGERGGEKEIHLSYRLSPVIGIITGGCASELARPYLDSYLLPSPIVNLV